MIQIVNRIPYRLSRSIVSSTIRHSQAISGKQIDFIIFSNIDF